MFNKFTFYFIYGIYFIYDRNYKYLLIQSINLSYGS